MNIRSLFKLINKGNAWSFIILFVRHPFNLILTFLATYQCVKISDEHYGKLHHKNNATNAFRHALWSYLIAKKCSIWRRNKIKVIRWTEKITDWHEEFSPNKPLEKEMDLHNNHIGRKLFTLYDEKPTEDFVKELIEKTKSSKLITKSEDIDKYTNDLVHIVEIL